MNYFILEHDPILSAIEQCDKHVVKMPVETAQMLSTAIRQKYGKLGTVKTQKGEEIIEHQRYLLHELGEYDGMLNTEKSILYWSVHTKHPCTLWTGESFENFWWAHTHGVALCYEYRRRYKRGHKSLEVMTAAYDYLKFHNIEEWKTGQTPFPQAMPDEYKRKDAVEAYRAYYSGEKNRFAKWTNAEPPAWWVEENYGKRRKLSTGKPSDLRV